MQSQKGFAITGVLYGILILFLTMLSLILFSLQGKKTILDKQKKDVYNRLEGIVETIERIPIGQTWDFDYTGNVQTFTAPTTGNYKLELWGAEGGNAKIDGGTSYSGGRGAYTSGIISLQASEKMYIYTGGKGADDVWNSSLESYGGGYNGGANSYGQYDSNVRSWGAGGGATDIRLVNGTWNSFESLKSRIMVAAGGGGASTYGEDVGGAAGGLVGYDGSDLTDSYTYWGTKGYGATQTSPGYSMCVANSPLCSSSSTNAYQYSAFGYATSGFSRCSAGGGGGYYGGGSSAHVQSAAGGSSFISGYSGCNAISESSTESNIIHTNQPNHYSGKVFTNSVMIDGKGCNWSTGSAADCGSNQQQPDGTNATGHSGNGYARITYLG